MRELVTMWKHTRMVVLTAMTAGLYAAILIPFKGIPIIPGVTELRPAIVVPIVFGLLFGPAGAWGAGIGNIIGDFFGTLGPGSFFGFFGNFSIAFVMYKMRDYVWSVSKGKDFDLKPKIQYLEFAIMLIIACQACAGIVAWGVDILKLYPFKVIGPIIFLNNFISGLILAPILFKVIYPRVKKWNLLWTDIMEKDEISKGINPIFGMIFLCVGITAGFLSGLFHPHLFLPFFALFLLGAFLL